MWHTNLELRPELVHAGHTTGTSRSLAVSTTRVATAWVCVVVPAAGTSSS
jgi:hypothetical protein